MRTVAYSNIAAVVADGRARSETSAHVPGRETHLEKQTQDS